MWNEHKHEFNAQNGRFKADQQYETVWKVGRLLLWNVSGNLTR